MSNVNILKNNEILESDKESYDELEYNNIILVSDSDSDKNNTLQLAPVIDINTNSLDKKIKEKHNYTFNSNSNSNSDSIDIILENNNINGWNDDANNTIKNWYIFLKEQSYIYQWVLDRNKYMIDKLTLLSICLSSILGIFTSFKLWIKDDEKFQIYSDITLIIFNFSVACITGISKRYSDDINNDIIRKYIEEIDTFIGIISAQLLKSPIYRINANEFFTENNNKYTKIITSAPNLSIRDISKGKINYNRYIKHNSIKIE